MSGRPIRFAEVVAIGDELLLGETEDTNFRFLAGRLLRFGVTVERHTTVRDREESIVEALREATARSSLVIATGGLGVTPDDKTRQALAWLAGVKLVPDRELLDEIEVFFRDRKIRMPSLNVAQASLPQGSRKIPNPVGLAPGIHMVLRGSHLFAFPGVPAELRVLAEEGLIPFLAEKNGEAPIVERVLRTWGRGETAVAEQLKSFLEQEQALGVAFLPEQRGVSLRLRLTPGSHDKPEETLDRLVNRAADLLGEIVYSMREEELEEVVASLLTLYKKSVAVAESCTGGRIADYLTSLPGSSAFFREGFVPYHAGAKVERLEVPPSVIEEKGTVSAEVASFLARQVRTLADADIGLGVTGVAGPEKVEGKPVGLVYAGLDSRRGTVVKKWSIPGSRCEVKDRAARSALNLIRLHLVGELA